MLPRKAIRDWWSFLAWDEYLSVRGDYVSARSSDLHLRHFGEGKHSGLRLRMTIHGPQRCLDRHRDARDDDVDAGNSLNAKEIRTVLNSALSRAYGYPIQSRVEDMTKFVDTKGTWGTDHVMIAEKRALGLCVVLYEA